MFELILTFLFVILSLWLKGIWLWVGLIILLALILPGMYSMYFAAPFLRTSDEKLEAIMRLGKFTISDRVYDLGCGDGKVIRRIARVGVKEAIGYEFSVPTYLLAKIKTYLIKGKEKIQFANFWKCDFADADVLICFFMDNTMKDFEKRIWPSLRTGTRVISNEFKMVEVKPNNCDGKVLLYVKN